MASKRRNMFYEREQGDVQARNMFYENKKQETTEKVHGTTVEIRTTTQTAPLRMTISPNRIGPTNSEQEKRDHESAPVSAVPILIVGQKAETGSRSVDKFRSVCYQATVKTTEHTILVSCEVETELDKSNEKSPTKQLSGKRASEGFRTRWPQDLRNLQEPRPINSFRWPPEFPSSPLGQHEWRRSHGTIPFTIHPVISTPLRLVTARIIDPERFPSARNNIRKE
ncbi:hypothetical protein AAG570_000445 [Ranatra chinensis]|uniref:Uncharacterized protein n=1 Tax=Ranatra chinensis TaxID=642074 RepID=A0ABD0YXD8_9HEMI